MYSPDFYRVERREPIEALIREYPFAVLLATGGEQISHLPFILQSSSTLLGHMARANPHWRELEEKGLAKVVFQGPHGYISPAWYQPRPGNVPTWSYAVVHVTGKFEIVDDKQTAFDAMNVLVETFESKYETGWNLPKSERAIDELMKAIVVFRLTDLKFEAKFKLNQKQSAAERNNVIERLRASGDQVRVELAEKMATAEV